MAQPGVATALEEAMESQSFDGLVELYDESRCFDRATFEAALDYIVERFPPSEFPSVFEPGVGTGRIAIPFAERGYRVTGGDISDEMMAVLQARLADRPLDITLRKADTTDLPFDSGVFDLAVAVHHFYHIREWRKAVDESMRVVMPGGALLMLHTGMGMEVPFLNDRYKQLCAEHGFESEMVGVKSTSEVTAYLREQGHEVEQVEGGWEWTTSIELAQALGYLRWRAYSFTVFATNKVHGMVMDQLEAEVIDRFGDLSTEVDVPNRIGLVIVHRKWSVCST